MSTAAEFRELNSHKTMKMRLKSDDTCLTDMYPPLSMYEPRMRSLCCMVMEILE
jgi:hypothetical protein